MKERATRGRRCVAALLAYLAALALASLFLSPAGALRFELESGHTKCVTEDIKLHAMAVGKYSVVIPSDAAQLPDSHKITVKVTSPYGNSIHYEDRVESGTFAFSANEEGDYLACVWAPYHQPSATLTVEFEWRTGVAAKDWTNVAKKGQIEGMELELKKLEDTVKSIHDEMFYLRERSFSYKSMSYINGMASFFSPNYLLQFQLPHEDEHRQLPAPVMPPFHNLQDLTATAPLLSPVLGKRSMSLSGIGNASDAKAEDGFSDDGMQSGEKRRRLNTEQVRALERSFELQGNKLESDRKLQLAAALGLHPRQIAIWFQNRRAKWKTKQLEMDYELLKTQFDAFKSRNKALKQHNKKLQSEILALKGRETTPQVINLNKETEGFFSNMSRNTSEIEQYYKNVENILEDGSFCNSLCCMGDHYLVPFWSRS
ncbi:uncharacterized protein LOC122031194 isoform X2 [Zingiber officinale]|uniref:uncharacterized protein LOC122031194 isoform X2 n=1 Tax=Zingiber officinale TaxID=94328 RepID=UPI001C4AD827|nr:uncharacterized protein LOC122031194 isoform X2 [Zingiber officinale]